MNHPVRTPHLYDPVGVPLLPGVSAACRVCGAGACAGCHQTALLFAEDGTLADGAWRTQTLLNTLVDVNIVDRTKLSSTNDKEKTMRLQTAVPKRSPNNPNPKTAAKADKLPLARRLEHELTRAKTKLLKLSTRYARLDDANAAKVVSEIKSSLAEAGWLQFASQVSDEAKVAEGSHRGTPVAVGSVVDVREKKVETYADILSKEEMTGLTVVAVKGTKLLCETTAKIRVFLPKGHVVAKEGGQQ